MKRLAAMQLWPLLIKRAPGADRRGELEVRVREDEIRVAAAELEHGLLQQLARLARDGAAGGPAAGQRRRADQRVLEDRRPRGCRSASVRKRFSGKPARRKTSSIASAQPGTLEACFSTAALPAISPGAAKRKTCQNGKFHGITASTTPSGWNATKLFAPGLDHLARQEALARSRHRSRSRCAFLRLGDAVLDRLAHLLAISRAYLLASLRRSWQPCALIWCVRE